MEKTKMMLSERVGLLLLAAILLTILALMLARDCSRQKSSSVPMSPDTTLVKSITTPSDTVKESLKKPRKSRSVKKKKAPKTVTERARRDEIVN